ncbi:MAG: TIGR01841 family phasin [Thauera sp.]|jgi:phasin family protein
MTTHAAYKQFADTAHNSFEQLQAYALIALEASEKLCALNFGAARVLCETVSANPLSLSATNLQDTLAQQGDTQGQALEQLGDYLRNVNEVVTSAQNEVLALGSRHFEELQSSMQSMLQQAQKLNVAEAFESAASESRSRAMRKAA